MASQTKTKQKEQPVSSQKSGNPLTHGAKRSPSVPEGARPVLIIDPSKEKTTETELNRPQPGTLRRDPLLVPEVVNARSKTKAIKDLGRQFLTLSKVLEGFIDEARGGINALVEMSPAAHLGTEASRIAEILDWMEAVNRDSLYLANKSAVGMAHLSLAPLVRDAVKRAYGGGNKFRFHLPSLTEDIQVSAHPHHLLDAITLAISMVMNRVNGAGELRVSMDRGEYFAQVVLTGLSTDDLATGDLPCSEDTARLRHLIVGLHQGTLTSNTGARGEVMVTIGLPLRTFEAEIK